ncbi:MAG: isochorismate pyruvate lyase [Campylobacterota bacterium]|nr:isochorismate pyruvate lyase [Campylobacterota bacterium]
MSIKNCVSLDEVREEIDKLDEKIVELIAKRSHYVRQAAKFKHSIEKIKEESRLDDIMSRVRQKAIQENISPNMLEDIYRLMIEEMVETEVAEFQNRNSL